MNKAIDWIENAKMSPYRLDRCELLYREPVSVEDEPMRYFAAQYGDCRPGNTWMFSLKTDYESGTGMRWTPEWNGEDGWAALNHD